MAGWPLLGPGGLGQPCSGWRAGRIRESEKRDLGWQQPRFPVMALASSVSRRVEIATDFLFHLGCEEMLILSVSSTQLGATSHERQREVSCRMRFSQMRGSVAVDARGAREID
jgi:hypothetical protein